MLVFGVYPNKDCFSAEGRVQGWDRFSTFDENFWLTFDEKLGDKGTPPKFIMEPENDRFQ